MTKPSDSIKKILTVFRDSKATIRPHFFLTGSSGSGKTYITETLCKQLDLQVISVNAASLTKEGVSGSSLSRMLTPLLNNAHNPVVCIVDEFDKLFNAGKEDRHDSTTSVQDEFLTALEGTATIAADYGKFLSTKTNNVLFIFAGAFGGSEITTIAQLKQMAIRDEFLGRVSLVYHLPKVSLHNMKLILQSSILLRNYIELNGLENSRSTIVEEIFQKIKEQYDINTIGVRLINMCIHTYFIDGFKDADTTDKLPLVT